ncbi:chromosome partition protein smc [Legionella lansingensis]|nr:chromosome segregation protein SMC [Legionella lansingensis]SNV54924.1 chromosome partition protein smc [Legionella lansingensis]
MQLKELKLAGFKSFVDLTVIPFPSQRVAVVGPNGCGKSNVIDAVRWVMGESSAKNLRGESMADVIFNGSSQRKAVGQASVELIFDNSLGRLAGQYGSYQEISVRRVVTRDGESSYYLNGTRCRRRDITDIFLGTGAGARGYSIIGQGTISRIVEARPEELRAYFEEAAGISKYKERRRETLVRIEHTRENLARVTDIRDELDKQLQRLERQAKAAQQFKRLKAEERLCKAEILALKWKALRTEQTAKQNDIKTLFAEYEKHQAKAAEAFKQSTVFREKLHNDNEIFQQIQTNFYQLATEIARLEDSIQQNQRERKLLKQDQQQVQSDWQVTNNQIQQDSELIQISEKRLAELQDNLQQLQQEYSLKEKTLQSTQKEQAAWDAKIHEIESLLNKALRNTQIEEVRLQHLNQRRQQLLTRLEKIAEEQHSSELEHLTQALAEQKTSSSLLVKQLQEDEQIHQQVNLEIAAYRQKIAEIEEQVRHCQDNLHDLSTKQAAIHAAQQTALGHTRETPLDSWHGKPRLVEVISVEKEWQHACEVVLGEALQATVCENLNDLWPKLREIETNRAYFLTSAQSKNTTSNYSRLIDKIAGIHPSWLHNLDNVYTANDVDEALSLLPHLDDAESIITADGYWLAKGWVKIAKTFSNDQHGLLSRQEELTHLNEALVAAKTELSKLKITREQYHQQFKAAEQRLEVAKQALAKTHEEYRMSEVEITHKERVLQQAEMRKNLLAQENEECLGYLEELGQEQENCERLLHVARNEGQQYETERKQLLEQKTSWQEILLKHQQALEQVKSLLSQAQLAYDREQFKTQQLEENIKREQLRLETFKERMEKLSVRLLELELPEETLTSDLNEKILKHQELDAHLNHARDNLQVLTQQSEEFEALVRTEEKNAQLLQEKIQQAQMQEQALAVRASGVIEALTELGVSLDNLLNNLQTTMTQAAREQSLEEIGEKIRRLGAINLAAIEEYDSERQRKQHLDEQYQDLSEALATLDAAIAKMDRETQQRLQNTFDEVNTAFQALFPRLFGGGRAILELTCDNLLEAGILVMAQPPGKRNSTIHLLSGGEKAMTAVALVFAIFQLNPSPFCMLDEVDAPLDDVNVGRFCSLVKEMSQFVQFLIITHNKITMELADHLIGVTMREPGVSRIVAVDVEQALSMSSS